MLKIQTISSGSSGNITYVSDGTTNILVDIGLSLSMTQKLLHDAHIDPSQITAILITHEHSDHIKGVADFVMTYNTPIYCQQQTIKILQDFINLPPHHFVPYSGPLSLGNLTVNYFQVPHDSRFCLGYTFTNGNATVGIATDIGHMTPTILDCLGTCQIAVLEANHDIATLQTNPKYPYWLKRRILSPRGHLSNVDCGQAVLQLYYRHVSQIILAHLSEKNNTPTLAYQTIKNYLQTQGVIEGKDIYLDVALQSKIGNCYCID